MKQAKNVPQLRFSGFDDEWEEKKLNEYLEPSKQKNLDNKYSKNDVLSVSGEFGIVNQIEFQGRSFAGEYVNNYGVVETNDIVYTKSPLNANPYGIIKSNFGKTGIVSTLYAVYKSKNNVDPCFIQTYFDLNKRLNDYLRPLVRKGAKNDMKVSSEDALLGNVVFPSKLEQQKIGAFLSHVDSIIKTKTKKLESLKAVKKSLLQKCFPKAGEKVPEMRFVGFRGDWEEKKLTDEVELYRGLTYTPKDVEEYGTLVLRSSNVQNGEIELEDNVFVDPKVVNSKNVEKGDIIVVVRNGSRALIGKHAQIKTTMHNTVIGAFMTGIKAPNPEFMNALLSTDAFTREVEINLGATINQITNSTFESMSFYFPKTIEEQQALGSFFSKYDSLISAQQKEIDKLKDIKKSLLQKMFI